MDLPYRAEYSKSNRSKCKACKGAIGQGILRMATMTQSPFFDGKQANWYHFNCFFNKQRIKSTDDIEHFESLRIEDQDRIREHVGGSSIVVPDAKGKGKKRSADQAKAKTLALKDFVIQNAKSGRSTCRGCQQKILKDEIRVSKKEFDSDMAKQLGGTDQWHHLSCFAQLRSEMGFFESADKIPGFKGLSKEEQAEAKKTIPAIKQEDIPEVKKVKLEDDPADQEYREQNKIVFKYRDNLKAVKKHDLISLLENNKQEVPVGVERMYDHLSDIMTFGALKPCKECKGGQLVFKNGGYVCTGNLTEWAHCTNTTKEPERAKFMVPKDLKQDYPFLKSYKYVARKRITKDVNPTVPVKTDVKEEDDQPKIKRDLPALYEMEFVILGQPTRGKDVLKKDIQALGGKVVTRISKSVMAVIANEAMVEKMGARIKDAETEQVHVVPEDFVDEAKENVGKIPDLVIKKSICNWGSDPTTRLPPEPSSSTSKLKSKSRFTSSVPNKIKLKLKGGSAVDPDSGVDHIAHVYEDSDKTKWTVVLGLTDVQSNKNSFYKLQLLEADSRGIYWVYKGWGRIGTTIGGNKSTQYDSIHKSKKDFQDAYLDKTGNEWNNRHRFEKKNGKMYPVDIDYGNDPTENLDIVACDSKLSTEVQDLIKLIFDVNQMKKLLLEFELDTEKMPLGKLSKSQIQKAFGVLSELQTMVEKGTTEPKLIEATNRFYTLIPHSFGVDEVPILRDSETIKQKLDMLDSLTEMEIAYNLMKSSGNEHTVDAYYSKLNTELEVVHKESKEFNIILEYLRNTHAATHSSYELTILNAFTVKRQGEEKRFKPFKKLNNRKLLWHGSRTTNFPGILSQGLRIAPPEAPVTGYMFGKGVYFADMVSKSANYCCTNPMNSTGILLLCEVALGNMLEKKHAHYVTDLPKGHHSVKGVGRTQPDPSLVKQIDGVDVPLGVGVNMPDTSFNSLLYNEYIVYDVAQIQIKYLLKVDFNYNYQNYF